jgi:dephospho-CoA kinase
MFMSEIKIGLGGEFRSGKNTVADYIEKEYGFVQFAFGDELKKGFHYEYPTIPAVPKPREGYQLYGQLKRYVFGADYWMDITLEEIDHKRTVAANYNITGSEIAFCPIITDVRQPNEFAKLIEEGYFIIKVLAPEEVRIERAKQANDNFDPKTLQHETELYIKNAPFHYCIVNDGTLEELYAKVDAIMADIKDGPTCSGN